MPRLKVVFFCGHESRYGLAHIEPILAAGTFDVMEVVLAPFERWEMFRSALSGEASKGGIYSRLAFARRLIRVIKRIRKLYRYKISLTHDINKNVTRYSGVDLLISVAYPQIFSPELINQAIVGAINFHPSFLPLCRGAHPIYWTIASREPFGGVSCHFMTDKLDEGPLVAQRKIEFNSQSITYSELYSLVEIETPLLVGEVESFFREKRSPTPQIGATSYFRNDRAIHRKINFCAETSNVIDAKIRSGGAFCFDSRGRRILLNPPVDIVEFPRQVTNGIRKNLPSGMIVDVSGRVIIVKSGDEFLVMNYLTEDGLALRALWGMFRRITGWKINISSPLRVGEILF